MEELTTKLLASFQAMLQSREGMLDFLMKDEPGLNQVGLFEKLAQKTGMIFSVYDRDALIAETLDVQQLIRLHTNKDYWSLLLESAALGDLALPQEIRKLKTNRSEFSTEVREIQYHYMSEFDQPQIDQLAERLLTPSPRILQSSLLSILNKISRKSSETFASPGLSYVLHDEEQIPEFLDFIRQLVFTFGHVLGEPAQFPRLIPARSFQDLLDSEWLSYDYRHFTIEQKANYLNSFLIGIKADYQDRLDQYLADEV